MAYQWPYIPNDEMYNEKMNTRNEILRAWATKNAGKIVPTSWNHVQELVRAGLHKKVFHIGDELTCKSGNDDIIWQVIGMDIDEPVDPQYKHSMTLLTKNRGTNLFFGWPQALIYCRDGLGAGDYYITVKQYSWKESIIDEKYGFRLSNDIPEGGQITLEGIIGDPNYPDLNAYQIVTYSSSSATTPIESSRFDKESKWSTWPVPLSPSYLCDIRNTDNQVVGFGLPTKTIFINSIQRAIGTPIFGQVCVNANYKNSAIRQWLNSDKQAGSVWQPMTVFDRPPISRVASINGFIYGLDEDFINVIKSTKNRTARNTLFEDGGVDITEDKFFLLSKSQVYGGAVAEGIDEGAVYPYFKNYSDLNVAGVESDTNRIRINNNTAKQWLLRTPNINNGYENWNVSMTGALLSTNPYNPDYLFTPIACNIFG